MDREALRKVLPGPARVQMDRVVASYGADVGRMWQLATVALYRSGDLPVLAAREALQNAADAIRAARPPGGGHFDLVWDEAARSLTFADNGIGMDAATIEHKFLVLGQSGKRAAQDSDEARGGYGIAKAPILGASSTMRWTMHTRDNRAHGNGLERPVEIEAGEAPYRRGTELTLFDVSPEFDYRRDPVTYASQPLLERLRLLLAANDLPGVAITLNGEVVKPLFSRRGGTRVAFGGEWGAGTSAVVKAYQRMPGNTQGGYWLRLNGLYQFRSGSRRRSLTVDVVIDLLSRVRPGDQNYPFNAARDALSDVADATLSELAEALEKEDERARDLQDDEVFEPEGDGSGPLATLAEAAFSEAHFQQAVRQAASGLLDYYREQAKVPNKTHVESAAPATSPPEPDPPTRAPLAGLCSASQLQVAPDISPVEVSGVAGDEPGEEAPRAVAAAGDEPGDEPGEEPGDEPGEQVPRAAAALPRAAEVAPAQAAAQIRDYLVDGPRSQGGRPPPLDFQIVEALSRAEAGEPLLAHQAERLEVAIEDATRAATAPGGGGILAALPAASAYAALDRLAPTGREQRRAARRNPFGSLCALRISRSNYPRTRARRFRQNFQRWIPYLVVWDTTLRLIVQHTGIQRRFVAGFVLDGGLNGKTAEERSGTPAVYVNPDRFLAVVRAHRHRPLSIAYWIQTLACHELTHLDGRMGEYHSDSFSRAREDLGRATAHLLVPLAKLIRKTLALPEPEDQCGGAHTDRVLEIFLDQVVGLLAAPPQGVDVEEVQRYFRKNRKKLGRDLARGLASALRQV